MHRKIASGRYNSASGVLKDALQLLEERELNAALHRHEIRGRIAAGYDSLRSGKSLDGEEAFARPERELEAMGSYAIGQDSARSGDSCFRRKPARSPIEVVRVLHVARDIERILSRGE